MIETIEKIKTGLDELETSIKIYKDRVHQDMFTIQLFFIRSLLEQLTEEIKKNERI